MTLQKTTNPSKHTDVISLPEVAKRARKVAPKVPKMLRGLRLANNRNPKKNVGLGWAFEKATKQNPQGIAIAYEDQTLSYQVVNQWANRIAHYFLSLGVQKGDVIAVYLENRPELLAFSIAMAKIGAIASLVNTSQSGKVLIHSIELVNAKYIVVGEELEANLTEVLDSVSVDKNNLYWWADAATLDTAGTAPTGYHNLAEVIQTQPNTTPDTSKKVYKDDGLYYIYTSGTTGLPKAVIFSHGRWNKAYGTLGTIMDLNSDDVLYATLPLYHATGIVVCWTAVIRGAGTLAIRRKFSASNFWKDVQHFNASAFGYVGELCRYLHDKPASDIDREHRVTKMVGNGLRPNIWKDFKQRFGIEEVFEFYASSEGNIGFSNIFNFDNTVGYSPLPYKLVQYDKENNCPVRDSKGFCIPVGKGEVGLLLGEITPKTPFDGYTDPEKTKAVVLNDVIKPGDSYFNTGDLMRDIGFKHAQFVDRVGDTFRWKGENVSTTEVENILSDHESVGEAIVYGVEINGTNGRAGMAALTAAEGYQLDAQGCTEMLEYLKAELPHYAVPVFIRVQQVVEQTGTFKYSKNKLKEIAFNPSETDEAIYVCLPGESCYQQVDTKLYEKIQNSSFRF